MTNFRSFWDKISILISIVKSCFVFFGIFCELGRQKIIIIFPKIMSKVFSERILFSICNQLYFDIECQYIPVIGKTECSFRLEHALTRHA